MCPVCTATVALIAAGASTTGGHDVGNEAQDMCSSLTMKRDNPGIGTAARFMRKVCPGCAFSLLPALALPVVTGTHNNLRASRRPFHLEWPLQQDEWQRKLIH